MSLTGFLSEKIWIIFFCLILAPLLNLFKKIFQMLSRFIALGKLFKIGLSMLSNLMLKNGFFLSLMLKNFKRKKRAIITRNLIITKLILLLKLKSKPKFQMRQSKSIRICTNRLRLMTLYKLSLVKSKKVLLICGIMPKKTMKIYFNCHPRSVLNPTKIWWSTKSIIKNIKNIIKKILMNQMIKKYLRV
jgi:hypothetical protein